jgi:hypothetical protein
MHNITANEGESLLNVINRAGTQIPQVCHHQNPQPPRPLPHRLRQQQRKLYDSQHGKTVGPRPSDNSVRA